MTFLTKHINIFFHSIPRNLHTISKLNQNCHFVSKFRSLVTPGHCESCKSSGRCHSCTRGHDYITFDLLMGSPQSGCYVTNILWTLPTSCIRYHNLQLALPRSGQIGRVRYKILQIIYGPLYSDIVSVCSFVSKLRYTLIHQLPIRIIKPRLTITARALSQCKHPHRSLPPPSWIMVTNSDKNRMIIDDKSVLQEIPQL